MRIILLSLVSLVMGGASQAAGVEPAAPSQAALDTIAGVDHRCRAAAGKTKTKPDRVFADTSEKRGSRSGEGSWREFPNPDALKGIGEDGAPNTQAFVWRFADGVVFVQLFFQSGSGDWAHFADHCFRADGTLARVESTLNTFNAGLLDEEFEKGNEGGVSRIRTKYFDRDGRLLRKTSRLLDLATKKPIRRSFMDQDDIIFKVMSALPFYRLLAPERSNMPLQQSGSPQ
jgi:hypothetical protein